VARYDSGICWDSGARWDEPEPSSPATPTTMSQNKISATLAAAAVTNITTAIATIRTNLPFLINLTLDQRKLAHAASSGQGVIQAALTFAAQHPEALPSTFDTAEFAKDGALLASFGPIVAAITALNEDVSDTHIALQSDLYAEFLDVYAFARANNRSGAYNTFIEAVKGRFAKTPSRRQTPAAAPAS